MVIRGKKPELGSFRRRNVLFYAQQNEINATVKSLGGGHIRLVVDPNAETASTNGDRVIIPPIDPNIVEGSTDWYVMRGLILHEIMHLQDSDKQPHMYDVRMLREWKLDHTLGFIHNLVLDHSIEQNQDYRVFTGVYNTMRITNDTLFEGSYTALVSNMQSGEGKAWCAALFVLDQECRLEWMPDAAVLDLSVLMAMPDVAEVYEKIKHLKPRYLQPKYEDKEKDRKLSLELYEIIKEHEEEKGKKKSKDDDKSGEGDKDGDEGDANDGDESQDSESQSKGRKDDSGSPTPPKDRSSGTGSERGTDSASGPDLEPDKSVLKDDHDQTMEDPSGERDEPRDFSCGSYVVDPEPMRLRIRDRMLIKKKLER